MVIMPFLLKKLLFLCLKSAEIRDRGRGREPVPVDGCRYLLDGKKIPRICWHIWFIKLFLKIDAGLQPRYKWSLL